MNKFQILLVVGALLSVVMVQGNGTTPVLANGTYDPVGQASAPQYKIRDLGTLGGDHSAATAVNVNDQVAGWSEVTTGSSDRHAFLWQGGRMRDLGTLGGANSEARGINRRGWVAGVSDTADGVRHAFLWRNGRMLDLGTLGGANSEANAINDEGVIVGSSETAEGGAVRAFKWEYGEMRTLGVFDCYPHTVDAAAVAVNRDGQVVGGQTCGYNYQVAILWDGEQVIPLNDSGRNSATGINHQEQIIILNFPRRQPQSAYLLQDGQVTELGSLTPPGTCEESVVSANGINETGLVVGWSRGAYCASASASEAAFLWRKGQMFDLGTLTGVVGSYSGANAISNQNVIVGESDQHAVMWRPR